MGRLRAEGAFSFLLLCTRKSLEALNEPSLRGVEATGFVLGWKELGYKDEQGEVSARAHW